MTLALSATALLAVSSPAATSAASASGPAPHGAGAHAHVRGWTDDRRQADAKRARQRRALERRLRRDPSLILKSKVRLRAQQVGAVLPFTIRFTRPLEGGAGDDVLQLTWDNAAIPWPLAGTVPATPVAPATALTSTLTGASTLEWDLTADTSGYSTFGTVETRVGGGISLTGTGFPLAVADPAGCTSMQSLDVTGWSLTSAGLRFGTMNPFTGATSGTLSLRTKVRTEVTTCGTPVTPKPSALAGTTANDPPLPVAFDGTFKVSPGLTSDGKMRFGILTVSDATVPQRTTFGFVHACTDPADQTDHCARKAFPVRTKLQSLQAEVLVGDQMPPPPADPPLPVAPVAPLAPVSAPAGTPSSKLPTSGTSSSKLP